jgi:hypothetical protein
MGSILRHAGGRELAVDFAVDLDGGEDWSGRRLVVQVLGSGRPAPEVHDLVDFRSGEVVQFTVPIEPAASPWLVLRIADPGEANGTPGPVGHPGNQRAVAYASPWYLEPLPR